MTDLVLIVTTRQEKQRFWWPIDAELAEGIELSVSQLGWQLAELDIPRIEAH